MKRDKFYLTAIAILLFLFLWQWVCKKPQTKTNEVVKVKLVPVKGDTVIVNPAPEKVTVPSPERLKEVLKTVYVREPGSDRVDTMLIPSDTAAILDYFLTRQYIDTAQTKYGPIIARTTVSENKLKALQISHDLKIPETTIYKAGTQGFIGLSAMGNPQTPLRGYAVSFALKIKSGKMFEAGAWHIQGIGQQYWGGVKFPVFGK